jgi:hypothetical protein
MRALLLLAAAASLAWAQDPRELVRQAVARIDHNLEIARNYTFLERSEIRELDADGRIKTRKIRQYDVTPLEGSPYRRLVGRDDHPLAPEEERQEQKKLEDSIAQRQKETPQERARRIAEWEKKRQRQREPLDEIADAFDFRMAGEERLEGRPVWVIDATPHPGYHPRSRGARLFPKLRGRLWIDKADHEWIKTECEVIGTISVGLFLVRLNKGARLSFEMTRVNGEVWLPRRIEAYGSAKVALLKSYHLATETTYSQYRKFQADSHMVPLQRNDGSGDPPKKD